MTGKAPQYVWTRVNANDDANAPRRRLFGVWTIRATPSARLQLYNPGGETVVFDLDLSTAANKSPNDQWLVVRMLFNGEQVRVLNGQAPSGDVYCTFIAEDGATWDRLGD